MKYRARPKIIEAFQMTPKRRWNNDSWPEWLREAWKKTTSTPGAMFPLHGPWLMVRMQEGMITVNPGDYIIRGAHGELYPFKPSIFEETYEPVEES